MKFDRYSAGRFPLTENGFDDISVGLYKAIPERVGRIVMTHEVLDENGKSPKRKPEEIPLELCSKERLDAENAYWLERGSMVSDTFTLFCIKASYSKRLYLEGDEKFQKNFSQITTSFRHCNEEEPEKDCASKDEVQTTLEEIGNLFYIGYSF